MNKSRGKKYYYLGMDLDFSVDGEVIVKMMDHPKTIVYDFPETIQ